MTGLRMLVFWCCAVLAMTFIATFDAIVAWTDLHSGAASWAQAIGSVLAIFVAVGIAFWQHERDVLRERRVAFDTKVAMYNGVLQLVNAVRQNALKLEHHCDGTAVQLPASGQNGQPGTPTVLGLEVICTQLETAIGAISRTDLLPLGNFKLIQIMQIAQSSASVAVQHAHEQLKYTRNPGEIQWHVPRDAAKMCVEVLTRQGDAIHVELKAMRDGVFKTSPVNQA